MRSSIGILTNLIAASVLCGAAIAAPAGTHNSGTVTSVGQDCRKAGNEVSALIDNRTRAQNLPAARAAFQVGVMECMEGDGTAANKHYEQVKQLLASDGPVAPNAHEQKQ